MDKRLFRRGARISPKVPEPRPLSEEMPFHEFMAIVGLYAVRDYKFDKQSFLIYREAAYEAARRALSANPQSSTGE